jgi:hypothetical protein
MKSDLQLHNCQYIQLLFLHFGCNLLRKETCKMWQRGRGVLFNDTLKCYYIALEMILKLRLKQPWNEIGREKLSIFKKHMCQYHFVHYISHMGWPGMKPGPLHNRPVSKCLNQRMWHSLTQTRGVSKKALSHVTNYSHSLVSSGERDVASG